MLQCLASYIRQFNTTASLHISRTKEPKIRTPSKKALAAKARRKAAIAKKEDQRLLKLSLLDAIAVLRVSYSRNLPLFRIRQQQ